MGLDYSKSTEIMQAYRIANDIAKESIGSEEEIKAYQKVIDIGLLQKHLDKDELAKTNMLMFWAYNNLGDLMAKNKTTKAYQAALEYYQKGLSFARDNVERISVLNRMAQSYKTMGNEQKWVAMREAMIENANNESRRSAYVALSQEITDAKKATEFLEKALEHIGDEDVTLLSRCKNTLEICKILLPKYAELKDNKSIQRIKNLQDKTANLAVRLLEDKIDNEKNRQKRLEFFKKLLSLYTIHMQDQNPPLACTYRRLLEILQEGEEIKVEGVVYNKQTLRQMLKKVV